MPASKNSILSFLAVSLFATLATFSPLPSVDTASAMETIFVTASQKNGRYDGPIIVRLTASHPDAKIWYTCKRNGTPSDLLKYESPILLSKSCAMIYFAYVTTELESKIERTDFTILYSDDIKLETEDEILRLRNVGKETVDIGGWELIAGTWAITIPPGTSVPPGDSYAVGKVDPASYALKSPEGYIKSELSVAPKPPVEKKPVYNYVAKTPAKINPVPAVTIPAASAETPAASPTVPSAPAVIDPAPAKTPTAVPSTVTESREIPEDMPPKATAPSIATPIPNDVATTELPTPTPPATPETSLSNIKASSTESKNTAALPIVVTLILVASVAIFAKRYQKK